MSRIINKLIRKISGSELAQKQNASIIKNGKPNEKIIPFLRPGSGGRLRIAEKQRGFAHKRQG